MISNQILQSTLDSIKEIAHIELAIADVQGVELVATSEDMKLPFTTKDLGEFASSTAQSQETGDCQVFKILEEGQPEYILIVKEAGERARLVGEMAVCQIQSILVAYKEHFDKDNFIKNLLLDNLLMVDIYNRAKKLHIDTSVRRVVIMLETSGEKDFDALEKVKSLYESNTADFVTAVDERNVIIVKELTSDNEAKQIEETAAAIIAMFPKDKAVVSYGTTVSEIKEVSRSYKEARMALDVGRIFFADRNVIAYSSLGIGRIIYQLPMPLCKMFIKEIFDGKSPDDFDEETIVTINKFFENNLNVSETSRQLYIHRNTLVYRLDKLQKNTGLDLRVFEDAITFRIALMVVKYMKYMETMEY